MWLSEMVWSYVNILCDVTGKCWNFLKQMLSYCRNKKLLDSISVDFMQIMVISQSSCGTCAWSVYSHCMKQVLRRDWHVSAISKLNFFNMNLKIFFLWCMKHQPGTFEMKHETAQIWSWMGSSIYLVSKWLSLTAFWGQQTVGSM